jgi:hypothetical protein
MLERVLLCHFVTCQSYEMIVPQIPAKCKVQAGRRFGVAAAYAAADRRAGADLAPVRSYTLSEDATIICPLEAVFACR